MALFDSVTAFGTAATPVSAATPAAPRLLTPQGWTSDIAPAVEWESTLAPDAGQRLQVEFRVTQTPDPESPTFWRSGPMTLDAPRVPAGRIALPIREAAWLWVRERPVSMNAAAAAAAADSKTPEAAPASAAADSKTPEAAPASAPDAAMSDPAPWSPWNVARTPLFAAPPEGGPRTIWRYDLRPTREMPARRAWEEAHLVAALQGLVNRDAPRLFVTFLDVDSWWLDELRGPGRWLAETEVVEVPTVEALVETFKEFYEGVVVRDREVDATSNVASTVAGVESLLPVASDDDPASLWQRLVEGGPRLSIGRDLRGMFTGTGTIPDTDLPSTGSRKCDAHVWARRQFLDGDGPCNPEFLGYYIDAYWIRRPELGGDFSNHTLTNHDYFISQKGFFWDLHVWDDEAPVDDPDQALGTDRRTLLDILRAAQRRVAGRSMIRIGGFNPWAFKYTESPGAGGKRGGVPTEWETVRIATEFDALVDADALHLSGMANASFYRHFPLSEYLPQNPAPTPDVLRRLGHLDAEGRVAPKTYLLHYVGDYDSAAWALSQIPPRWNAPERGTTLLGWAVNPNLAERAAPVFEYMHRTRSGSDFFQSGDSGAGYVNPTGLLAPRAVSGLPPAGELWQRHSARWFRRMNLTVTGFIINALSGPMTPEAERLFASFSGDGIVLRDPSAPVARLEGRLPCIPMGNEGLPLDPEQATGKILELAAAPDATQPAFTTCRSVLYGPAFYREVERRLTEARPDGSVAIVEPRAFFYLLRTHLGGDNTRRATVLFDTLASSVRPDAATGAEPDAATDAAEIEFQIALRNDGWDTWAAADGGAHGAAVALAVEFSPDGERHAPARFALPHDVAPGDAAVVAVRLPAPSGSDAVPLRAELVRGAAEWFAESGCLPLTRCATPRSEPV